MKGPIDYPMKYVDTRTGEEIDVCDLFKRIATLEATVDAADANAEEWKEDGIKYFKRAEAAEAKLATQSKLIATAEHFSKLAATRKDLLDAAEAERDGLREGIEQAILDLCEGCREGWPIDFTQEPKGRYHNPPSQKRGNYIHSPKFEACTALQFKAALAGKGE